MKNDKNKIIVLVAGCWWSSLLFAGATMQTDVLHYDLSIAIYDSVDNISGSAQITLWDDNGNISLDFSGMTVDSVLFKNRQIHFQQLPNKLTFTLPTNTKDSLYTFEVFYRGIPEDGLVIKKNKYGRRTFFADNWPDRAHNWFPCNDRPDDKATFSIQVFAPAKYQVVSNGPLVEKHLSKNDRIAHQFAMQQKIAPYCAVFGAAEFEIVEIDSAAIPLRFWGYDEDMPYVQEQFALAPEIISYFISRFGAFPFPKLDLVQSSTRYGGMENPGAIFFNEFYFKSYQSILSTLAHEIAHQWWGDWITPQSWRELWLSEGFASYLSWQFFEEFQGEAAFHSRISYERSEYLKKGKWHNRAILEPVPEKLLSLLNPNNYKKGAFVLHMLRREIGDSLFWQTMRHVVETHANGHLTSRQFEEECERISGRELQWFFTQWLREPGIPVIASEINHLETGVAVLRIQQIQKTPIKRFPLEIGYFFKGEKIVKTVNLATRDTLISLPKMLSREEIVFDPNHWLLAEIKK